MRYSCRLLCVRNRHGHLIREKQAIHQKNLKSIAAERWSRKTLNWAANLLGQVADRPVSLQPILALQRRPMRVVQ